VRVSPQTDFDPDAFKKFERRGWVEVGDRYHDTFSRLTLQATEPLLDAVAIELGTRLLDVASGPGYIAAAAARRGARVTAIDFSITMVDEGHRLHPGIDFREGDAEALAFADGEFDAVTCGFGLLHFARPERAVAEAFRVLKPGGRYAFTVWDTPERARTFGLILGAVESAGDMNVPVPPGPPFFRFSDHEECRRVLADAGFVAITVENRPARWNLPSADALLELMMSSGVRTRALLNAQTPERLIAIRTRLRELARPHLRHGELELPTPFVLAAGTKA
jgi:SAM-dependent methyltransferase